jgi:hypothetical protein
VRDPRLDWVTVTCGLKTGQLIRIAGALVAPAMSALATR